ncbi:MAG: hypothetical protein AAF638_10990 [Pseudomonadota bacterium]
MVHRFGRSLAACVFAALLTLAAILAALGGTASAQTETQDAETPVSDPIPLQPNVTDDGVGAPTSLTPRASANLQLAATLAENGDPVTFGAVWRIYSARSDENGQFPLIYKTDQALPTVALQPGTYVAHVAYGRAQATETIQISGEVGALPVAHTLNLNAGGLRLWADVGEGPSNMVEGLTVAVFSSEQDEYGDRRVIAANASLGTVIRLNSGTYYVVSQYGDANATVRADAKVEAGQITDATVLHKAAPVTLKLVNEAGGEALANTRWNVLTPGGDLVVESVGAFPTHIFATGEYEAIARHEDKVYNKTFNVEGGVIGEVEIVAE